MVADFEMKLFEEMIFVILVKILVKIFAKILREIFFVTLKV
jgi:hypothetical protein